jgi:uncharacterized protein with ATP-grasp and redox domains
MNVQLDCVPCFVRHALDAARHASPDPAVHERILREVLREAADWDLNRPAPLMSQFVQRRLRKLTDVEDLYLEDKRRFNSLARKMLPACRRKVAAATDPLEFATRLAIAGNIIDFGSNGDLRERDVIRSLSRALSDPFAGDLESFRKAVTEARRILYLADNAGEIFFDRLLIEQLPAGRVTVAVRGAPVLNDATLADARLAGLNEIADVIGNGSDAPGTVLHECSAGFRQLFESADAIIAKGQGNFETLAGTSGNIFFLLKIKCPVVAAHTGVRMGTQALIHIGVNNSAAGALPPG